MASKFVSFEIVEHLLTLSTNKKGWSKELNRVSWEGREAGLDLRSWNEDHTSHGKGMSISNPELKKLRDYLNEIELD